MKQIITSIADFERVKNTDNAFVLYLTDGKCDVGKSIAPKLESLIAEHFPKLRVYHSYPNQTPELAAQLSVFIIPTLLVFFNRKLYIQKSRAISLAELGREINRYYQMAFKE